MSLKKILMMAIKSYLYDKFLYQIEILLLNILKIPVFFNISRIPGFLCLNVKFQVFLCFQVKWQPCKLYFNLT